MGELSPLAFFGLLFFTNGTYLLLLVLYTVYSTPWFDRILTDIKTNPKPHWTILGALYTIALIVSKPVTQIGDWWSDVAFIVEMRDNETCDVAKTDMHLSIGFLMFHQFASALLTYLESQSNPTKSS